MKNDLKKTIQSNKTLRDELAKTRKENEELNEKKKQALSNLQSKINTIKRMKAMEDDVKIKQEMWEHEKARMQHAINKFKSRAKQYKQAINKINGTCSDVALHQESSDDDLNVESNPSIINPNKEYYETSNKRIDTEKKRSIYLSKSSNNLRSIQDAFRTQIHEIPDTFSNM